MGEQGSLPPMSSMDCWDYTIELECLQGNQDLQLAAELGKTLLERNKELENALKQHQNVIEDQTQEIEYLTKQTAALREVNDSRLRIYEQLEVSIQDLERANHRLALENAADKKHIKSLTGNIETLEQKCEELQGIIDDLRIQVDMLKRKAQQRNQVDDDYERRHGIEVVRLRHVEDYEDDDVDGYRETKTAEHTKNIQCSSAPERSMEVTSTTTEEKQKAIESKTENTEEAENSVEQMTQLLSQLRESRSQINRDQRRITELEEQLATMVQQNQALENQIMQMHNKDEDMKSMHEELTTLEEVRQGQMCSRCLRSLHRNGDDFSLSLCDEPEDDDSSMLDALCNDSTTQHRSSFTMDVQDYPNKTTSTPNQTQTGNLYRDLVQKYEALLEIHRQPTRANNKNHLLSLQEEMQLSGDFSAMNTKDTDEESGHGDGGGGVHKKMRKTLSHTPTDFSEAETSSSGFADETSNKGTQTEGRPGSFLCTIADGEDCRFSIYDDASPIDSRFRNRPEYRELFKEIFTVLKKAAENKDEGEELPLLDDHSPVKAIPKVPPVTPCNDTMPDFPDNMTDDTQSVLSSTMSELSTSQLESVNTTVEEVVTPKTSPKEEPAVVEPVKKSEEERVLTPLIRQPLEYISVGVNIRKRSSSRRKNRHVDRSDSPVTHIIGSPKITYSSKPSSGRKNRDVKGNKNESENVWNGNTLQFWSSRRNVPSPTPSQKSCLEYRPSTASQDLHKLKRLDLSYAEVLRNASNKNKSERVRRK